MLRKTTLLALTLGFASLAGAQNHKVTLLSPTDGQDLVSLTATFTWDTAGIEADTFSIEFSKSMTFADTLHMAMMDVTENSYVMPGSVLENDSTYYWRVVTYWGDSTEQSDVFSFTTIGLPPGQPVNVSPNSASIDVALYPTLTWTSVPDADQYRVWVSIYDGFTDTVFHSIVMAPDTSVTINVRLNSYTVYYWRVAAENENGLGEWSNFWNFTTLVSSLRGAEASLMLKAYPNPASEQVGLQYENKGTGNTLIRLFDLSGKELEVLYDGNPGAGTHQLVIPRGTRESGVYLIRVEENGMSHTLKVVFQ